jgi:hypothetical protein
MIEFTTKRGTTADGDRPLLSENGAFQDELLKVSKSSEIYRQIVI